MKRNFLPLNNKIARRLFSTFLVSAVFPMVLFAGFTHFQLHSRLQKQTGRQLHQAAKNHVVSIYEHLLFCEEELKLNALSNSGSTNGQSDKFEAMGKMFPDGRYESVVGAPISLIALGSEDRNRLKNDGAVLSVTGSDPARIILIRQFHAGGDTPGLILGTIRNDYLFGTRLGNSLPPLAEFAVMNSNGEILFSTHDGFTELPAPVRRLRESKRLVLDEADWISAYGTLFMEPQFGIDSWFLVVAQPGSHVKAPISQFSVIFGLVLVLALLLVAALGLFNLRRMLDPINALKTASQKIALSDFSHRVNVSTKDEFQDLAKSFNRMSLQLEMQFQFMAILNEINSASLQGHGLDRITDLTIVRGLRGFPFMVVSICWINGIDFQEPTLRIGHKFAPESIISRPWNIDPDDRSCFHGDLKWITLDDDATLEKFLPAEFLRDIGPAYLFPIFVNDRLEAVLSVAGTPGPHVPDDGLDLIRKIADQIALSTVNYKMIVKLRQLTTGSLQALARTVDAKSPWTAGHSARVMCMAKKIATYMGLTQERIDLLEQAAMLHDIGKIGIPSEILNKTGNLTDEEFAIIRSHSAIGDKILTPIPVFQSLIPMVRHHHERWDGKGYPDGLRGDEINLETRILAVADTYDAMVSDRPYRHGMDLEHALSIIESEGGRQFDPDVSSAFVGMMREKNAMAA